MIYCFDIDGTICNQVLKDYTKAKPFINKINKINNLYDQGHTIIFFTSRFMGRNNDNSTSAKKQGYKTTFKQLKKWGLKFHELKMGKTSYDLIIDDKSLGFKKNWLNDIKKYLKKIT